MQKQKSEDRPEEVQRKLEKRQIGSIRDLESYSLNVCHPESAGIDLGSEENYVALPPSIAAKMGIDTVHRFSSFTHGMHACRDLLLGCGIKKVAMESTSVYRIILYGILQSAGIEVSLVNPRKFRMVPGRKTDVLDCQWLQTLHAYGLLQGSFHPSEEVLPLRTYLGERENLIRETNRYVLRIQKAFTRMNLLLHNVIEDIMGGSGIRIIKAILAGERDPYVLADLCDLRIKATVEEVAASLTGYYKQEQLDLLEMNYQMYCFIVGQIEKLDHKIEQCVEKFPLKTTDPRPESSNKKHKAHSKNKIKSTIKLEDRLFQILGVDLTVLPGIALNTALLLFAEAGFDLHRFPSAKSFANWLGFAPHNKITGGRIISSKTDRVKSTIAQAFKRIIPSISRSDTASGAFYRRLAPRIGTGQAIVATCRKLAIMVYNTIHLGTPYVEMGQKQYLKKQQEREQKQLEKLAKKYHLKMTPIT